MKCVAIDWSIDCLIIPLGRYAGIIGWGLQIMHMIK